MSENPATRTSVFTLRSLVVLTGLSLLFSTLLIFAAKPLPYGDTALPPAPLSGNFPYFLLVRLLQKFWGQSAGALLAINGLLMLAAGWIVYRTGWGLSDDRHRLLGATTAMVLFLLNPLVLILPLTLGFLGGHILVPFCVLCFVGAMGMAEHWSAFMRSIAMAVAWSLLLWVHLPTAFLVLLAMIPWVLYSRRPVPSLGTFLTVLLLGSAMFAAVWAVGCALSGRWAMVSGPVETLRILSGEAQESIVALVQGQFSGVGRRLVHTAGWLSPFLLLQGLWVTAVLLRQMLRNRRSSTEELEALMALAILFVVLFTPGRESLPGAWFLLPLLALWTPLIAQELALKETFFSRGFRLTVGIGFGTGLVSLGALYSSVLAGQILPSALAQLKLVVLLALAGGASYAILKKHPLSLESRAHALLVGATLAYFLVMDFQMFR